MQTNVNDLIIAPNKIRYIYFHETRKPISKWLWQKFANAASIMNPGLPDLTFNIWQVVLSRFPRNSSGAHVREGRLVKTMEHWILDEHGVMLLPSSSRFSPSSSPSSLAGWLVVKWTGPRGVLQLIKIHETGIMLCRFVSLCWTSEVVEGSRLK